MILVLRTDKPESYVALYREETEVCAQTWEAGRQLSDQLLNVINELCEKSGAAINDIAGVIVYKGPGSYTGLRIGVSVANAVGYANDVPVVAVNGGSWISKGVSELKKVTRFIAVVPEYGGDPHITQQKK